jgi:hypothetical protein
MARPLYPQLRKYPVRSGTYASCQKRSSKVVQKTTRGVENAVVAAAAGLYRTP